jgi:hypothetical protein
VGEGWIWAPDHGLLQRVEFPPISTLDTSKTPKAGDAPISAPVLAGADISNLRAALGACPSNRAGGEREHLLLDVV